VGEEKFIHVRFKMIQFSRVMLVAAVVGISAACSEGGPTGPKPTPMAARLSAAGGSASCTVAQNGSNYDVTVSWSGLSTTSIDLWQVNASQPMSQTVLGHPTRKGSVTILLSTVPDYAVVAGRRDGIEALCSLAS
jgi:hypothetical protein